MSTAADQIFAHRASCSTVACLRLLDAIAANAASVYPLLQEIVELDEVPAEDPHRAALERLAGALWAVFSHHRAVSDAAGRHVDLGSWRAAAEMITDVVNRHHPEVQPALRYMDCYMGVLAAEDRRAAVRALYRWLFTQLREAGCDWRYTCPTGAPRDRRDWLRRAVEADSQASVEARTRGAFAPVPPLVAAYQDVYGMLPDGWPHV